MAARVDVSLPGRRSFCGFFAAGLAGGAEAQPARPAWRLATGYRAESFHGRNLAQWIDELGAAGLPVELHANNRLLPLAEIFAGVQARRIELGETILTGLVAQMPLAGADAVPFVVRGYADAQRLWLCQRPSMVAAFAERGLVALFAVPWPPQGLYAKTPITRLADLRGQRMRTYNSTTERFAELVGAQGVQVPMVQVGQALADGRIDCMITSAVTGVEGSVWRYLKHYYDINAWIPKNITFANAAALAELPEAQRAALQASAQAAEARGWAASVAAAAQSMAELRANGMAVAKASPTLVAELVRLGERFALEWLRQVGPAANRIFVPYYTQQ